MCSCKMGESDSEEDPDFQPDEKENDESDHENAKIIGNRMSGSRKRKVDLLWEELQNDENKYLKSVNDKVKRNDRKVVHSDKLQSSFNVKILSSIFGPTEAAKLCHTNVKREIAKDASNGKEKGNSIREDALELIKKVKRKVKVVEKRKFAGEEIRFSNLFRLLNQP